MNAHTLRKLVVSALAVFALASFGLAEARAQSSNCNNESWKGAYGFTLTGWRIPDPAQPTHFARAGVGRLVADGRGNLSGAETKSRNGLIIPLTFTGTYQVNTDCTGTAHIVTSDPDEQNRNFNFTITESGEQVVAIQTDQGRAVTVIATRQRGK